MSGFELRELDDGRVELLEFVPKVIATFIDRAHAVRYHGILIEFEARGAPHQVEQDGQEKSTINSWAEPTDLEWEQAFQALERGDGLKKIAAALNVNPFKLQGKFGAWMKKRKPPAALEDMEECRLCGTNFRASSGGSDLCARCSRG